MWNVWWVHDDIPGKTIAWKEHMLCYHQFVKPNVVYIHYYVHADTEKGVNYAKYGMHSKSSICLESTLIFWKEVYLKRALFYAVLPIISK